MANTCENVGGGTYVPHARSAVVRAARLGLLLGVSGLYFLPSAAWAAQECGPLPPEGGPIICPAGEYPNGINYAAPDTALELRLEPGFVALGNSVIAGKKVKIVGPLGTSFRPSSNRDGAAALRVSAQGPVSVELDDVRIGLEATSNTDGIGIIVKRMNIKGQGDGITATGGGTGAVHILVGDVSTANGNGIRARNQKGPVEIRAGGVRANGGRAGGRANGSPAGGGAGGIFAFSETGEVRVTAENVTIRGAGVGVLAQSNEGAVFVAAGDVKTETGTAVAALGAAHVRVRSIKTDGGTGITAGGGQGPVTVTADRVVVRGPGVGIDGGGRGDTSITVESVFAGGKGINVVSGARLSINAGFVTAGNAGILGDTRGIGGLGVTAKRVTVLNKGPAIAVASRGPIDILAGTLTVRGEGGAIVAGGEGNVTVTAASVTTADGSAMALWSTSGTVTVNAGNVSAAGASADAIQVAAGTTSINISGTVTSASGRAVRVRAAATAAPARPRGDLLPVQ